MVMLSSGSESWTNDTFPAGSLHRCPSDSELKLASTQGKGFPLLAIIVIAGLAAAVWSSAYGYTIGKSLAIAYLKAGVAGPGDTVDVAILGRSHRARVLDRPAFDPDGHRLRDRRPVPAE